MQLYIAIYDDDFKERPPDELVDVLLINHTLSVDEESPRQTYAGMHGYVTMDLSVTVVCAQNFEGSACSHCVPGFTGVECQVNIDDCKGVNCSGNGHCVDGINSFTCECKSGFSGHLCNEGI